MKPTRVQGQQLGMPFQDKTQHGALPGDSMVTAGDQGFMGITPGALCPEAAQTSHPALATLLSSALNDNHIFPEGIQVFTNAQ